MKNKHQSEFNEQTCGIDKDKLYKEINMQMLDCIKKGTVPYLNETPLVQDMNVVSGHHFGDINKIRLELKASQINAKSLKWIYKADADFMGLKLKDGIDTSPLIVYGNINRDGKSFQTESQPVYLLDQFTDESLKKALECIHTEGTSPEEVQRRGIAEKLIVNITEYDSGINEKELRENKRKNISTNLKNPEIMKIVSAAYNNATQFYDKSQKLIFGMLNNYFIKQETALNLKGPLSFDEREKLKNALEANAKVDSPRLLQTMTECFLYTERLTHYGFNKERIYTKDDLNKSLDIFSPSASSFEPKKSPVLNRNNEIEKIREREHEIKPRHVTHQRGL